MSSFQCHCCGKRYPEKHSALWDDQLVCILCRNDRAIARYGKNAVQIAVPSLPPGYDSASTGEIEGETSPVAEAEGPAADDYAGIADAARKAGIRL